MLIARPLSYLASATLALLIRVPRAYQLSSGGVARPAPFTYISESNTMKKLFVVFLLALCTVFVLSAGSPKNPSSKSYELTFSSITQVGTVQMKPGDYTVKIVGDNAVFTQLDSGKQFTAPVKVETVDKKYDDTHINGNKAGEGIEVKEIELGGAKLKLVF